MKTFTGRLTRNIDFEDLHLKSGTVVDYTIMHNGPVIFLRNGWWLVDWDDVK